LFKDVQTKHSRVKGDHIRQLVDGVMRTVCVYRGEKCKVSNIPYLVHVNNWKSKNVQSVSFPMKQTHAKQFQTRTDVEMFQSFIGENPHYLDVVTKGTYRKFKPWWIHNSIQE